MNVLVSNYDPLKDRTRHTFIVDIEFVALEYPIKKIYNEIYSCIFEPKTKVPIDNRSVCKLFSNVRMGKKNILKYLFTKKTHTTLKSKKRFPMYVNNIKFLTQRVGCKVRNVYNHYTF